MNLNVEPCRRLASALVAVSLLAACTGGTSKPSESSARQTIEQQINNNSQGHLKLRDFQKTNGIEGEVFGTKIYELQYEAVIEPTVDCYFIDPRDVRVEGGLFQPYACCVRDCSLFTNAQMLKKGEPHKVKGSLKYTMTEKGWR